MRYLTIVLFGLLLLAQLVSCKKDKDQKQIESKDEISEVDQDKPMLEDSQPITDTIMETITETDTLPIWSKQYYYTKDSIRADLQVRVGDVDNLGFGWDPGFDPFCGKNTNVHRYPWEVDSMDHQRHRSHHGRKWISKGPQRRLYLQNTPETHRSG